jgi:hypothetical protein
MVASPVLSVCRVKPEAEASLIAFTAVVPSSFTSLYTVWRSIFGKVSGFQLSGRLAPSGRELSDFEDGRCVGVEYADKPEENDRCHSEHFASVMLSAAKHLPVTQCRLREESKGKMRPFAQPALTRGIEILHAVYPLSC